MFNETYCTRTTVEKKHHKKQPDYIKVLMAFKLLGSPASIIVTFVLTYFTRGKSAVKFQCTHAPLHTKKSNYLSIQKHVPNNG